MSQAGKKMAVSIDGEAREGEVALDADPARLAGDDHVVFVGHVESPWTERVECPKNMAEARTRGGGGRVLVDEAYRPGLDGLEGYSHAIVLTWFDRARRDLIVQKPRHAERPRGTFALRSPVRPNPIGVHVVRLVSVDAAAGILDLEAIDLLDGTPVVDIKPYFASTDAIPDARRPGPEGR